MSTSDPRLRRRLLLSTITGLVVVIVLEGLSWIAIIASRRLLDEEIRTTRDIFREQRVLIQRLIAPGESRLLVIDSVLGWRYRAGHADSMNETNGQGLRSRRTYAPTAPIGVVRVAAFGDSFVYGNEVANNDCWSTVLEALDPRLEILNYGVGGYGVDQAHLRFLQEGDLLAPHIVVIGFAPVDLGRVVNVYRRFLSNREVPLVKPRYILEPASGLVLLPTPVRSATGYARYVANPGLVRELGRQDDWYEPAVYENAFHDVSATVRLLTGLWVRARRRYLDPERVLRDGVFNGQSTAFRIQAAIFAQFASDVRALGATPLVVIFPDLESVFRRRTGREAVYAPIVDELLSQRTDYVDLAEAFVAAPPSTRIEDLFAPGGHYSLTGNALVAAWLAPRLLERARPAPRGSASSTDHKRI